MGGVVFEAGMDSMVSTLKYSSAISVHNFLDTRVDCSIRWYP